MKKILFSGLILVVFSVLTVGAYAAENRIQATLDAGYYSSYVGGLTGMTAYNHSVFQQSVSINDKPTGLSFKAWSSFSPNGGLNNDFGDEVDFSVGISRTLGKIGLYLGYSYYDLYDLENTRGDLHAVCLTANLPVFAELKPYITIEQDIPVDKEVLPGGFVYKAGIGRQFKLPEQMAKGVLNLDLSAGGHDGAYGKRTERLSYVRLEVSPSFKVKSITVSPGINFQKGIGYSSEAGGATDDRLWYGINFSVPLI